MEIIIYLIFVLFFAYAMHLTKSIRINNGFFTAGFVLMIIQLLCVWGSISNTGDSIPIDYYSDDFTYYAGIIAFYVGFFIWGIIALFLIYIPIFINYKKYKQNNKSNSSTSNLKVEKEKDTLIHNAENNDKKHCTKCGNKIENEWKFCNYCGNKLK